MEDRAGGVGFCPAKRKPSARCSVFASVDAVSVDRIG